MSYDLLLGLAAYAFVTSVTPGPNNLMLMASGANFGLRRTLPHLLGVSLGFVIMASALGAGLGPLFTGAPVLRNALKALALCYMLWLAWKIATATPPDPGAPPGRPLSFLQAAAFQWVNPKAWAMALTALAAYAPGGGAGGVLAVAAVFGAVNLPSVTLWAGAGQGLARWLSTPRRLRRFNLAMAALLLAALVPVLSV
ncbi:hypothetical protein DDZ14_05655 [Maritimibacter sp. 55A14]|uniref:LysE family translocator n=1 Tax=Maritimibacter sp. 55A14 TaxID=2174844 RepID=UPI000D60FC24|nr:LysE family translocator [Maritimibacter sp. 55A14]PWE33272.1 hypothetical protein DDZ14_05655 [Maritimibacter sp. 55A14]